MTRFIITEEQIGKINDLMSRIAPYIDRNDDPSLSDAFEEVEGMQFEKIGE